MTLPKLLPTITVPVGWAIYWKLFAAGATEHADVTGGTYSSILEFLAQLEDDMNAVSGDWTWVCSSKGFTAVHEDTLGEPVIVWSSTTNTLEDLLGFVGTETQSGGTVVSTYRHLHGFYSPVGGQWPADPREIPARVQETEDAGLIQYASSSIHRYRDVTFGLLSYAQLEAGGLDSDGSGSSTDWTDRTLYDFWVYTRDRPFRFYEDATDGTVADPGAEGEEYLTCRRMGTEWRPSMPDQGDYSLFDFTLPMKIVGS